MPHSFTRSGLDAKGDIDVTIVSCDGYPVSAYLNIMDENDESADIVLSAAAAHSLGRFLLEAFPDAL